jgi:hypothetical protein
MKLAMTLNALLCCLAHEIHSTHGVLLPSLRNVSEDFSLYGSPSLCPTRILRNRS